MISPDKPYVKAPVLNGTFLQRKHFGHLWFLYRKVSLYYTWIIVLSAVTTRELVLPIKSPLRYEQQSAFCTAFHDGRHTDV